MLSVTKRNASSKKSGDKFAQIVNAAAEVFREKGYKEARLEDIASEVGMLKGSLYYYIDKKEDLLYEVVKRPLNEMTSKLKQIANSDENPKTKLEKALKNHVKSFEKYQSELFVWISIEWFKSEFGGKIAELGDEYDRLFRKIVKEGIEAKEFRGDLDPKLMVFAIFGVYNYMQRWYSPNNGYSMQEVGEQFDQFVLQAISNLKK